jgi:hypothetical protein
MIPVRSVLASAALLGALPLAAADQPTFPDADRVRLAEAFRIRDEVAERVWRGWEKAPLAVLLVTPDHEFLVRHPRPSPDFTPLGHDAVLDADVYVRPRVNATHLLATFPAVPGSPVSTIVIGQAENTDKKTSTPWVITVLHEHFHQLQSSQPGYYADVEALGLSRGDTSGIWMLDFPFPYDDPEVKARFARLSRLLADALRASKSELPAKAAAYRDARREFRKALSPDDARYFAFQVWQEGIARYTELRVAQLAAKKHEPSEAFRALPDDTSIEQVAKEIEAGILHELSTLELDRYKRVAFYPLGAGEGLLLDRLKKRWQERYFTEKFDLDF